MSRWNRPENKSLPTNGMVEVRLKSDRVYKFEARSDGLWWRNGTDVYPVSSSAVQQWRTP